MLKWVEYEKSFIASGPGLPSWKSQQHYQCRHKNRLPQRGCKSGIQGTLLERQCVCTKILPLKRICRYKESQHVVEKPHPSPPPLIYAKIYILWIFVRIALARRVDQEPTVSL